MPTIKNSGKKKQPTPAAPPFSGSSYSIGGKATAIVKVTNLKFGGLFSILRHAMEVFNCDHKLGMIEPHEHVSVTKGDVGVRAACNIEFRIIPKGFYPVGITFALRNPGQYAKPADVRGLRNFPREGIRTEGQSLFLFAAYLPEYSGASFKFSIIVQSEDGETGIIDPEIIHQPNTALV